MTELFDNIPQSVKNQITLFIDCAIDFLPTYQLAPTINRLARHYVNERTRDFVDFYFNMKMEQMIDESNSDQR